MLGVCNGFGRPRGVGSQGSTISVPLVAVGKEYIGGEELVKLFVRCNGTGYQCRSASPDVLGMCGGVGRGVGYNHSCVGSAVGKKYWWRGGEDYVIQPGNDWATGNVVHQVYTKFCSPSRRASAASGVGCQVSGKVSGEWLRLRR